MGSELHVVGEVVIRQSGVEVEAQSGVAFGPRFAESGLVWSCSATRALHHYEFAHAGENLFGYPGNTETAIVPR